MTDTPDPGPPPDVELHAVEPLSRPPVATIRPPGSKSLTNRALVVAALADGRSELRGALAADDTAAMAECVAGLGAQVTWPTGSDVVQVDGVAGVPRPGPVLLGARLSGTTARFVLAACALGPGPYTVDGDPPLRARPMGGSLEALADLGLRVEHTDGRLPVTVSGGPVAGGQLEVRGDVSSQYLSGLAMAGACLPAGLVVDVDGPLVSMPYVELTVSVMRAFGADAGFEADTGRLTAHPGGYRGTTFTVEADASAASYFLAAAAVTGGTVRIEGVGASSTQGDVAFAGVLERMGADVQWGPDWIEVTGPGRGGLRGISVDLADLSDTAPTLAAVAVFADTPTEVTGVGFIRGKETDRIAAVVTELRRLGLSATETPDGFVVEPGVPRPAAIRTYDDHRMAMAFTLVGLVVPGVRICDPRCVGKTYPRFFEDVELLRTPPAGRG